MLITGVAAQVNNVDALTVFTGAIKEAAEADVSISRPRSRSRSGSP